ncbi:MAG: response regulator transcription factor [Akkermansia sp.]
MQRILVVEDDIDIAELIAINLARRQYEVFQAHDGVQGLEIALKERPDLIILDVMMPLKNGYQVLKELNRDDRTSSIPVLFLTAKAQTEDRIAGLELGADDYVTKPFSPKELMLRVQAILKRNQRQPGEVRFTCGPMVFDKNTLKFYLDGEPVDLTGTEFKLLLYLTERVGQTQDRNDLLRHVWGYSDEVHSRTLDTHMKRVRQKLGIHAEMIETVRGTGYRVIVPDIAE